MTDDRINDSADISNDSPPAPEAAETMNTWTNGGETPNVYGVREPEPKPQTASVTPLIRPVENRAKESIARDWKTRKKDAFCSFCGKSYIDVGPLVEGPGDIYICGVCVELCRTILIQERRRRGEQIKTLEEEIETPEEETQRREAREKIEACLRETERNIIEANSLFFEEGRNR